MADLEIEIDGRKLTAKPNQTVIQVADDAGIYIPRFCYHKHLSIPANCRMCLVEVEKMPKAVPACATPVAPGMKIFTKSQKTVLAQRAVMEFLLINHPLDCPICDQGGECELQDLAMGYGSPHSEYDECKHSVADEDLGPLVATEMTRCIKCTRCVRFGDEIAGIRELGALGRGEDTEISTYIAKAMKSEISGNIIDLCPVGALTSKPYRFTSRPWDLDQFPTISPHDCLGGNIFIHTRFGKVMRAVSRENQAVNQTWISDRDRFSYTSLYHADRLEEPMILEDGKWQVTSWQHALEVAAAGLKEAISQHGADKFGALASPNSTLEEFYLLQKLTRALGSPHVDHRLREMDTRDQDSFELFPGLNLPLNEIENCDAIVLIGSNIQKEQPLLGLRVRQAALKGAKVVSVNAVDYSFNFPVAAKIILPPQKMLDAFGKLETELQGKNKVLILLGALVEHHPQAANLRSKARELAKKTNASLGILTTGGNSAGGWFAGAVPHRHAGGSAINHAGLSAYEMMEKARKAYLLLNVEPEYDCANTQHAITALSQSSFTVALSMFRDPALEQHADVILPIGVFTETSGTYINLNGEWQGFKGVAEPFGSSRPAWKVLRVLANFLQLEGFDYESSETIKEELENIKQHAAVMAKHSQLNTNNPAAGIYRIGEIPIYSVDGYVRRSEALQSAQKIMEGDMATMRIHPETAAKLKLEDGMSVRVKQQHESIEMPVEFDDKIAPDAAWIAGGISVSRHLGELFAKVEIEKN